MAAKEIVLEPQGDCLVCVSHVPCKNGYITISRGGLRDLLHRYFYKTYHGHIPEGFDVHHKCANKLCVAEEHLEAISRQDHNKITHAHRTYTFREKVIARFHELGKVRAVAREFAISHQTVRRWVNG